MWVELHVSNRQRELAVIGSKEGVMNERILEYHVALRSALEQLSFLRLEGERDRLLSHIQYVTTQSIHTVSQLTQTLLL